MIANAIPLREAEARARRGAFRIVTARELLELEIPPRFYVLDPVIPEAGLAMLYAPRGVGKTFVSLSIAHAVACAGTALRWKAPAAKRVCIVDGEMPLAALQERLGQIIAGADSVMPDDNYLTILAADAQRDGLPDLATHEGWNAIEPAIEHADLVVLDNLSTLARSGRENEAESWNVMQERLLGLRRRGKSVLLVHHAGKGGAQRGTSRREDVLDTVIALRLPSDYVPEQGCRFAVHFEKARGLAGGDAAKPFEAALAVMDGAVIWNTRDLVDVEFDRVVAMLRDGLTVRDVADETGMSRSAVGRFRKRAEAEGLLNG